MIGIMLVLLTACQVQTMPNKIPHRRIANGGVWDFVPVELTGKCKRITYPSGDFLEYVQCQRRIFGIKCGTYWCLKGLIKWLETMKVEYYDCNLTG